jgi:signal transduction histidine kinase/CheY-like chemotaxis protein
MTLVGRVLLIVLVALLPALAAEIYNQATLRTAQQAELRDDALRAAHAVSVELGRALDGSRNALVALAALPSIATPQAPACEVLLRSIGARFAFLSDLALVGADDRLVCASAPGAGSDGPPATWPQVRAVRASHRFAVSGYVPPVAADASGRLGTALPVARDGSGSGPVLVGDIGLSRIANPVRAMAMHEDSSILVLDRQGRVLLAEPDGPAPGSRLPDAQWAAIGAIGHVGTLAGPPQADRPGLTVVDATPDFVVSVQPSSSQAALTQRKAARRSYLTFGAGLVAAIACAVLLARRAVARPASRILRTITLWRLGAHQPRVPVSDTRSELGRIGRALNDLLVAFERTEAELRASKAELERRVETRTEQLRAEVREREATQALLQQSQKMEVIGQLTGGVAHDFNNLLTAVLGNLELASRRSADRPEVQRLLANATRAAERGAALTQRMLAFGRRQFLRPQAVDLAALLAGMEDLLARTIGPTVLIGIEAEPGLWRARADANQLELVVLNLAINARDAMPNGGHLRIRAANRSIVAGEGHVAGLPPGDYVQLSLHDDGIGMDAPTLARVLEPFFTTKPAGKGSGLGLSMAQGVAAQLGGGLAIASAAGQGTQVDVLLPREAAAPPQADAPAAAPTPAFRSASVPVRQRAAVLLVDDDAEVAEVTRQCLEAEGYSVRHAATGADALALIDSGAPCALLLADLAMPGMNGAQLAAQARGRRPGLPVLLATGYAELAQVDRAAEDFPVLEKPFRSSQLLAAVAGLLGEARV